MLEITGDDIAALNDEDLRTLVGRLCEAELRARNLTTSAVTWGGDQDAPDGGVDVRVRLQPKAAIHGFVPKSDTGFQVKKSDMPRGAIIEEMKPKGMVRPVILELARASGAYVIVSAAGSTSDVALKNRRKAMSEALLDVPGAHNLTLDFYDRNRLATWVRDHVGLIPWIRSRIGKAVSGWRSYGSWSRVPAGTDPAYLVDETARINTGASEGDALSATDGINKMRDVLRTPGRVLRLVGLSGVGKTRLVEALFDERIGQHSLDPTLAVYTDIAESPVPQATVLAANLIAAHSRAILVIDNCPPDIHRQLSEVARVADTTISVITIEYDIRDDQPEGTDVFSLATSSLSLIEALVSRRFPNLSQVDARTIAEFSGGNARIAIALAGTVANNETIAGLSDEDLFRRLFHQRHDRDASLLSIAQVCSLVYSFEGDDVSSDESELSILGGVIGRTSADLFSAVADLRRRDLLQARGRWRAVLPQAIANRLAATALQNIPPAYLDDRFVNKAPARLLQSFSRRIGYLDGSREARAIVDGWLRRDGILGNVAELDQLGRAMFRNVAPVSPEAVLSALETALADADEVTLRRCSHFVRLLRSLAYEPALFERAIMLLVTLARAEEVGKDGEATKALESLFYIVFSGTHASLELRLGVAANLLSSADRTVSMLGAKVLLAMLKTAHFSTHYEFEFGARSRNYGFHPKGGEDVRRWFEGTLKLAETFALSNTSVAMQVRTAIAEEFRGLWTNSGRIDDLERISRAIGAKHFWREGWIAARQTRIYDGRGLSDEIFGRLIGLEEFLRPKDLTDRVRGLVIGSRSGHLDLDDVEDLETADYAASAARAAETINKLGHDVAKDDAALTELLPELLHGTSNGRATGFGHAMAVSAETPHEIWHAMVTQLAAASNPNVELLCGFIGGLQRVDGPLATRLLDDAVFDLTLAEWLPVLQSYVIADGHGVSRLLRALDHGKSPIWRYRILGSGRTCDPLNGTDFKRLVLAIADKKDGLSVALHILAMRLHSDHVDKRAVAPEVVEAGRELLAKYQFNRKDSGQTMDDYDLGKVTLASLADNSGKPIARQLCSKLSAAVRRYEVSGHDHDELMSALLRVHPTDVLDELFSGSLETQKASVRMLNDLLHFRKNPMKDVPDDVIIGWCEGDPQTRYPLAAAVALLFKRPSDGAPHEWTNLTKLLLLKAPNPEAVLKEVLYRLHPRSWSGSLATKLESRLKLLNELDIQGVPAVAPVLEAARQQLQRRILAERRAEIEEDATRGGSFE